MNIVPMVNFNNGKEFPAFGLGTRKIKPDEAIEIIGYAIDVGYRHIDCGHAFENEAEVGAGIAAKIADGTVKREDLYITSKLWNTHHRPEAVESALRVTLKNLGLEYLDMYLIHWPIAFKEGDELFPLEVGRLQYGDFDYVSTWRAMEQLYQKGLVRSIGVSNFNKEQLEHLLRYADVVPATNQVEHHPLLAQTELVQYCVSMSITITAYSPLGAGDANVLENPQVCDIALNYNKTIAQVLIRYAIQRGFVVIAKSATKYSIVENIDVFDFEISEEDMNCLMSLDCNFRTFTFPETKYHKHYPFHASVKRKN